MRRRGRPTQDEFAPDERLYFRWFSNWLEDRVIRPGNVPTPNQSVNRQGHGGRQWHVLIPNPKPTDSESKLERKRRTRTICTGIIAITAADVPGDFVAEGHTYSFVLEHDPLEHNYQHCEVRVYCDGRKLEAKDLERGLGKKAKLHYRTVLARHATIVLAPEVATGNS